MFLTHPIPFVIGCKQLFKVTGVVELVAGSRGISRLILACTGLLLLQAQIQYLFLLLILSLHPSWCAMSSACHCHCPVSLAFFNMGLTKLNLHFLNQNPSWCYQANADFVCTLVELPCKQTSEG
jgi:hypothetical protein